MFSSLLKSTVLISIISLNSTISRFENESLMPPAIPAHHPQPTNVIPLAPDRHSRSLSVVEGPSPAPERPFRPLSGAEGPAQAPDCHSWSLSGAEGPVEAAEESSHRRNSVRFAHSGPSQRQHRPRYAQTCCRRAPPPAPVRGWTGPPVAGSSPSSLSS